jgi:hypothetical protein
MHFKVKQTVSLKKLNLDNNFIIELDMNSFNNMKNLTHLSFCNNREFKIMPLINFSNSMVDLPLKNLRYLYIRNMPFRFIRSLRLVNLLELDLSHNLIDLLIARQLPLNTIRTISILNLTFTNSRTFNGLFMNRFGPTLTSMDLSLNKIQYLNPNQFMNNSE